jgi:hypothetical protein
MLNGMSKGMFRIFRHEYDSADNERIQHLDANGTAYYETRLKANRTRTTPDANYFPDTLQPQCVKDTCIYNKPDTYILYQRNDCTGRLTYETCIVQCLNGYRSQAGWKISEQIQCLTTNHFANSTVRCERQTCV